MKKVEVVIILFVICVFLLAFKAYGQVKPVPPVTEKEQLNVRTKQVAVLTLSEQKKQSDKQFDDAIQAAQVELSNSLKDILNTRKITLEEYSLCDGPQTGACADAPKGSIVLRPNPKPEKK